MIPLVVKGTIVDAALALANRGLRADKLTPSAFPGEVYAEVADCNHEAVQRWFLEISPSDNCQLGGLLFYRYGDDA